MTAVTAEGLLHNRRTPRHHDKRCRKTSRVNHALSTKTPFFRVRTAFDSPERREADTLIFKYLESLHKEDPTEFVQNWVKIALDAEQSAGYGWDLLYD